jgi:lipopolysaccharide export system protein LptA
MYSPALKGLIAGLLCNLVAASALALPDDREQPISIKADKAVRDEKQGFTVYSGNVVMEQGSLHIEADSITIYRIVEEADKIVATGNPAHLQQQPEPDKALMHAKAGVIEYYKQEDRIHMVDNALIEQDGSTVRGNSIDYYIEEQLVKAESLADQADSRVEVIIPAAATRQAEDSSGKTESK